MNSLITELPTFVAVPVQSWIGQQQPLLKLQAIVIWVEVVQRYVLTIGLSCLRQRQGLPYVLLSDERFGRAISLPTLGEVNYAINQVNKHLSTAPNPFWQAVFSSYKSHLEPLVDIRKVTGKGPFDRARESLAALRNERLAHSLGMADSEAETLLTDAGTGWNHRALELLEKLEWLRRPVWHRDGTGCVFHINGLAVARVESPPVGLPETEGARTFLQADSSWVELEPLFTGDKNEGVAFPQVWLRAYADHILFQALNPLLSVKADQGSLYELFQQLLPSTKDIKEVKVEPHSFHGEHRNALAAQALAVLLSPKLDAPALFWLGGGPGIGKSEFIRAVIRDAALGTSQKAFYCRFVRGRTDDQIRDFILSLLPQLPNWLRRTFPKIGGLLPSMPIQRDLELMPFPDVFELFSMTLRAVNGLKSTSSCPVLVFAFDNVDELSSSCVQAPKNVERLAALAMETASNALRWVFVGRNEGWSRTVFPEDHFTALVDGRDLPRMSDTDMYAMFYEGLTDPKRMEFLCIQKDGRNSFLSAVYAKSNGYPFYVRLIRDDVTHGRITIDSEGTDLPAGAKGYFDCLFDKLAGFPGTEMQLLTSFLVILSIKREPLSLRELQEWANFLSSMNSSEDEARTALQRLRPLLNASRDTKDVVKYVFFHEGLRETILEPEYARFYSVVSGHRIRMEEATLNPFASSVPLSVRDAMLEKGLRTLISDRLDPQKRRQLVFGLVELLSAFSHHADRLVVTGAKGLTSLIKDLEAVAEEATGEMGELLRVWATMYRQIAAGLQMAACSETSTATSTSNERFVYQVASLALGTTSVSQHVRIWAEKSGLIGHLFVPRYPRQRTCRDIRWTKKRPWLAARIGEELFFPGVTTDEIEVIDFSSLDMNRTIRISAFNLPAPDAYGESRGIFGLAAVPNSRDLIVATSGYRTAELARVSSVNGELIWGPVAIPETSPPEQSREAVLISASEHAIAFRRGESDVILLYEAQAGTLLGGLRVQNEKPNARLQGIWRVLGFFRNSYTRGNLGFIVVSDDGSMTASESRTGNVHHWDDRLPEPGKHTEVLPNLHHRIWLKKAGRKVVKHVSAGVILSLVLVIAENVFGIRVPFLPRPALASEPPAFILVAPLAAFLIYVYAVFVVIPLFRSKQPDRGGQSVVGMCRMPCGRLILAYESGEIAVADAISGKMLQFLDTGSQIESTPYASAIASMDEDRLVLAKKDGRIEVWNITTEKLERTLSDSPSEILCVSASPGQVVSATRDHLVRRWVIDKDEIQRAEVNFVDARTLSVARTPDGRRLAVTSGAQSTLLWNLDKPDEPPTELCHHSLMHLAATDHGPAFTHNGSHVIIGDESGRRLLFWHIETATYSEKKSPHFSTFKLRLPGRRLSWSEFLSLFLAIPAIAEPLLWELNCRKASVVRRFWKFRVPDIGDQRPFPACDTRSFGMHWLEHNEPFATALRNLRCHYTHVATNESWPGIIVAGGSGRDVPNKHDDVFPTLENIEELRKEDERRARLGGWIRLWDTEAGKDRIIRNNGPSVGGIALTDEGDIVVLDNDGLLLWKNGVQCSDCSPTVLCHSPGAGMREIELSFRVVTAGKRQVAALLPSGALSLWDTREGRLLREWQSASFDKSSFSFCHLAAAQDGRVVTAGGNDFNVHLWDITSDNPAASFPLTSLVLGVRVVDDLIVVICANEGLVALQMPPKQDSM